MSLQNVFITFWNILGTNHPVQVSSLIWVFGGCHYKRLWNEDSTTSCNENSFLNKHTVGEFSNELCPMIALFICTHRLLCFSTLIYANQVTAWMRPKNVLLNEICTMQFHFLWMRQTYVNWLEIVQRHSKTAVQTTELAVSQLDK